MAMLDDEERKMIEAMRSAGHEPMLDKAGNVDFFAIDINDPELGAHNGPMCTSCSESWCQHCWARDRETIAPCKAAMEKS